MSSTHDPGAKNEIVQAGPAFRNFRRQCVDIANQAEIRAEEIDVVVAGCLAQVAHSACALFGVAADKDDTNSRLGQHARDRLADPVSAAGHQRNAPLAGRVVLGFIICSLWSLDPDSYPGPKPPPLSPVDLARVTQAERRSLVRIMTMLGNSQPSGPCMMQSENPTNRRRSGLANRNFGQAGTVGHRPLA